MRQSAAARVCREDLGTPDARDARRLKVVVDGLPLFGGTQLAVDTNWCPPFRATVNPVTEWLSPKRDGRRFARALRSSIHGLAPGWWC